MSNDHSSQDNYRPRSPDLSAFQPPPLPKLNRLPSYTQPPEASFPPGFSFSSRASYDASPYFSPQTAQPPSYFGNQPHQHPQTQSPPQYHAELPPSGQSYQSFYPTEFRSSQSVAQHLPPAPQQVYDGSHHFGQPFQSYESNDMARLRNRKQVNYNDDRHDHELDAVHPVAYPSQQPLAPGPVPQTQPLQPQVGQTQIHTTQPPVSTSHIDVKTKFPVARIKRIMQADEDVGKVAQATPTAVSKALEMFMIALVTKGAGEAKTQNSKRVTATHLKTALLSDSQFDFLNEICESVPDEGAKKGRAKSEAKSEDSDEDIGPRRKSKASSKRKKGDESD